MTEKAKGAGFITLSAIHDSFVKSSVSIKFDLSATPLPMSLRSCRPFHGTGLRFFTYIEDTKPVSGEESNYGPGPTSTIATGSFSYSSSLPAGQLTYSDLSSFSITVLGVAYNLPFVMGSSTGDYSYFGWNTASDSWVPANVSGNQGTFAGILAATQLDGSLSSGFFFDPLVSQSSLGNNDGIVEEYSNAAFGTVTSISTTPLPSTWPMLISGLLGIGFLAYRRSKKQVAPPVAA